MGYAHITICSGNWAELGRTSREARPLWDLSSEWNKSQTQAKSFMLLRPVPVPACKCWGLLPNQHSAEFSTHPALSGFFHYLSWQWWFSEDRSWNRLHLLFLISSLKVWEMLYIFCHLWWDSIFLHKGNLVLYTCLMTRWIFLIARPTCLAVWKVPWLGVLSQFPSSHYKFFLFWYKALPCSSLLCLKHHL